MKSYVFMDRINRIYQLELHQIRHFAAVAETGSFTKAADRAAVTQPGLSASITMERENNCMLNLQAESCWHVSPQK